MCNKTNYGETMKQFLEFKRIEKAAKAEKEKYQMELSEYMKSNGLKRLEYDGITATYTEYSETQFDKKMFETKAPRTFQRFFNLYHKTVNKSRFTCN